MDVAAFNLESFHAYFGFVSALRELAPQATDSYSLLAIDIVGIFGLLQDVYDKSSIYEQLDENCDIQSFK